ncbi:hypothetical protein [Lysobacter fragariae]
MSEALELQIEEAWVALTKMPPMRKRTLCLTRGRSIVWDRQSLDRHRHVVEIGTYTREVTLADFRDDVFYASEQMRDKAA